MMEKKKRAQKKAVTAMVPVRHEPSISVDPQALVEAAIKQGAGIEIIQQLLDVRERLHKEAAEIAFREAMAEFQRECPVVSKKRKADRYMFAPLEDIVDAVGDLIAKHGFSYSFKTEQTEKTFTSYCHINHISGHTEVTSFTVPVSFATIQDVQATGAARSYSNRYAMMNGFGIVTRGEDKDGGSTGKKTEDDKRAAEAKAKIDALPDNIKKGFELLDYKSRAVWEFCNSRDWDNDRIYADINKIIDRQVPK